MGGLPTKGEFPAPICVLQECGGFVESHSHPYEIKALVTRGQIDIVIDSNSIDTGLVELEEHLKKPDFLEVERYPTIRFISTGLQFSKDSLTGADGNLTLHGVTKPVHLDVTHFKCGLNPVAMKQVCGADVITSFKRSDFGVSKYVPMIADDVQIQIQIEAIKSE